jgi:hypothetical protein
LKDKQVEQRERARQAIAEQDQETEQETLAQKQSEDERQLMLEQQLAQFPSGCQ